MTPLMYAVRAEDIAMVKALVEEDASPYTKTAFGVTALDMATTDEIRKQLLEKIKYPKLLTIYMKKY